MAGRVDKNDNDTTGGDVRGNSGTIATHCKTLPRINEGQFIDEKQNTYNNNSFCTYSRKEERVQSMNEPVSSYSRDPETSAISANGDHEAESDA